VNSSGDHSKGYLFDDHGGAALGRPSICHRWGRFLRDACKPSMLREQQKKNTYPYTPLTHLNTPLHTAQLTHPYTPLHTLTHPYTLLTHLLHTLTHPYTPLHTSLTHPYTPLHTLAPHPRISAGPRKPQDDARLALDDPMIIEIDSGRPISGPIGRLPVACQDCL
jgi:hypothetical protein